MGKKVLQNENNVIYDDEIMKFFIYYYFLHFKIHLAAFFVKIKYYFPDIPENACIHFVLLYWHQR